MHYYPTQRYILTDFPNYMLIQMQPYRVFSINRNAFDVLKHIGYGVEFEQIVLDTGIAYDKRKILRSFLDKQVENGILDTRSSSLEHCIRLKSRPKGQALERIFLELTQRCNFSCMHCYMSASSGTDLSNELSFDEVCNIIDQADAMGVYRIDFTGGEIFTRKDLFSILEYTSKKFMITNIFTNGYYLTQDVCERLNALGNIHIIFISLDDHHADLHDRFRGMPGSFDRVINAIENLKRLKIRTVINLTINNMNIDHIQETLRYCNSYLNTETRIAPILYVGRGKCFEEQVLNQDEVFHAMQVTLKAKLSCIMSEEKRDQDLLPSCGVGHKMLYIRAEGEVCLCPTLSSREHPDFKLGDVRKTDISKIWNESLFRKKFQNTNCKNKKCEFYVCCKGGCRSRAYLQANKLDDEDKLICSLLNNLKDEQKSLLDSLSCS